MGVFLKKSYQIQASAYGFLTVNQVIDPHFLTFRKKIKKIKR